MGNKIARKNVEDIFALTPLQQGMLFHYLKDPGSSEYVEQLSLRLKGTINDEAIRRAWNHVVQCNEMLRTVYKWEKLEAPVQIVQREYEVPVRYVEIREKDEAEKLIKEIIEKDKGEGIDIGTEPFRITVAKLSEDEREMIITNHHMIYDGWSSGIIVKEFIEAYESILEGKEPVKWVKPRFKEYVKWLQGQNKEEQLLYWKDYLEGYEERTTIAGYRSEEEKKEKTAVYYEELEAELKAAMERVCRKEKVSTATVINTAWGLLLQRYNNTGDSVFGTTVSGRAAKLEGIEEAVGLYINTLPLRVKAEGKESILEVLRRVERETREREAYESLDLAEIQGAVEAGGGESLFDTLVVIENYPINKYLINREGKVKVEIGGINEETNYDITIGVMQKDKIGLTISYKEDKYEAEEIKRLAGHLKNILCEISENSRKPVKEIEMISKKEQQQLLYEFNDTYAEYPKDKTIHELFEAQVEKTPDNIAVVYENSQLTYRELNEKANQLARVLRQKGTGSDNIVGIIVERSLEMIVGIMGILKAGGAYLPIDSEYPADRIRYMLEDSRACILLTQKHLREKIKFPGEIIEIDEDSIYAADKCNLELVNESNDLAYVIYTSGSTGKPKGVMIEHRRVINLVRSLSSRIYEMYKVNLKVALVAPYIFDASIQQIFGVLLLGHTLFIMPENVRKDGKLMLDYYEKNQIDISDGTPAHISIMTNSSSISSGKNALRHLIIGGEQLSKQIMMDFYNSISVEKPYITNVYGPTECCVDCTSFLITMEILNQIQLIPIGKPLLNNRIYILDKNKKLVPEGVRGELYIAGDCVGRGYINNPELTAEKFIDNPFEPQEKMYKTGDLARWLPDGNIEFLGRIDHQVKIRGYRIELGEIENQLLSHEAIKDVVVAAREDKGGNKYLCAYMVGEKELTVAELRSYLGEELPDYMIPPYFVYMDRLPLTPNGKINRKALPEPDGSIDTGAEYEAARDDVEKKLVNIWKEVLRVDCVGINDNFFDLGGHSLKATSMMSKIHKELDVEIPLREIFRLNTIKQLAGYIRDAQKSIYAVIEPVEKKTYYAVSSAQKRLYVLNQIEGQGTSYNMPGAMMVEGHLDREKLEKVFNSLVKRHETLRTYFELVEGEPVQRVHEAAEIQMEYSDNTLSSDNVLLAEEIAEIIKAFVRPFELDKAPLLRVGLVKLHPERHILLLDMHHIISDGVSMGILTDEFVKLYNGEELPQLRIQYKDYSEWQNEALNTEEIKKQEEYWLKQFSEGASGGEIPVLNMPTDYPRPSVQSFEGSRIQFVLEGEQIEKLKRLERETGATLYMILLAAYNVLLSKYTGLEDIIIGSPIAGRPHADLENIIGMFVNTLAMRNCPEGNKSFESFLQEVKENALKAYENQDYQFEALVDKLNIHRDISRNPLFDTMFALENMNMGKLEIDRLYFTPYQFESGIAKSDITLTAAEEQDRISFNMEYCTKLFNEETVKRLSVHYINVLKWILENPKEKLSDIDILTEEEKNKLLYGFNDTNAEYPKDKTIHELFEEQVERAPDNIAVVYEDSKLTYRELNEKSNQLARMLREKGVGPDHIIAIMVEHSLEMLIGILGILKAGGSYLPIDPEYPDDRIEYMLEDSGISIVLVQSHLTYKISRRLEIIELDNEACYIGDGCNLQNVNSPRDLAYTIYTSGSTGRPKGTEIEHKSLINLCSWHCANFKISERDKSTKYAGFGFDASVWEVFPYLISGASIYMLNSEIRYDVEKLNRYMERHGITISFLPTHMCEQFMNLENKTLRLLLTGGDKLRQYRKNTYEIVNNYGPTENTVVATSYEVDELRSNIPIGQPINNTQIYILDEKNNLKPIGVPGELCIAGDGLARGYLNRRELAAEKFVQNPFILGERMYRTGDLARWLPDGNIEFLGRIDHQVKLRGYRIELGEIENRLMQHETVEKAVVIAKEDSGHNKYLCAYLITVCELTTAELRAHLQRSLPDYMIPSYFIQLDKMPLNSSGKIDLKALPEVDGNMSRVEEYEAPRNETEEKLVQIWREVLKIERIGINENFFDLGGHSLKATSMVSKIHKELCVEVPLKEIFRVPTIKGLAEYIKGLEENIYSRIEPVEEKEYYELSSAQKRLYTLQQFDQESTVYNVHGVLEIEGKLDVERLEGAFRKLIERHEAFRTSFELIGEEIVQRVYKKLEFGIECSEAREEVEGIVGKFVKAFDLSKAPLLRVGLIKVNPEKHILMCDMHHIISDGTSMGIMMEEFVKLYEGKELPELRIQYKDYAAWQNRALRSEKMRKQEEYWMKQYEGEVPMLNLQTDYARPAIQSFEGDSINFEIDEETTEGLRKIARETGATMYMVLLAAYNILLSKYSGQEDIVVGSPIAGRPHSDLENIMGMFVNTLAMRNYPEGRKAFKEFVEEVKTNALRAYENQDYQFEELVEKLNVRRDMSRNPLFDVMLILQNTENKSIEIAGLRFSEYEEEHKVSKFDITINAVEIGEKVGISLEYCTKLFKKETINGIARHLKNILRNVSIDADKEISEIEIMDEEEKHKLLYEFNDTYAEYPRDKSIQELFEEQVERTPYNIAVVYEDKQLSYRELNERSNQLARILREKGVGPDKIVGIMVERSLEMMIGIMGILKAGGAYLPIDPEYPEDRIEYMLEDSGVGTLLTQKQLREKTAYRGEIIELDNESIYAGDNSDLEVITKSNDLAYVIYTSGSTGKPKGVMIINSSLVNYITWFSNKADLCDGQKSLLLTSYAFDLGYTCIFPSILNGLELHILHKEKCINSSLVLDYIYARKINYIKLTPSIFNNILDNEIQSNVLNSLELIVLGGEQINVLDVEKLNILHPHIRVMNHYGPTESTIGTISHLIDFGRFEQYKNTPVIGKPINNARILIVDKYSKLTSIGIPGELCIAGDSLARGYLNRQELTAEKFVENPFEPGTRMYRTGDLARWLPDGNIEFLGRIDHQVKIRGFRIELGEIENRLLSHREIKEAVVVAKEEESGSKYLCTYIVGEKKLTVGELREYLGKTLPDYMIPPYFVQMEKMPLTPNGKIDRKALPEPDGSIATGVEYEAARNEIEEKLVKIWQEVLGIEKIGINDNFFDLGGHSLKATSMMSKIHKELSVEVPLKEIFRIPTIKGLSGYIKGREENIYAAIELIEERPYYELSSAQKRIYTLQQFDHESTGYNMPGVQEIEGKLEVERLENAFRKLIERHEAFRTSFELIGEEIVQKIHKEVELEIEHKEAGEEDVEGIVKSFIRPFALSKAPLLRVGLIKLHSERNILMFDMHHIISDGTSMGILTDEFIKLYEGQELSPLRLQYKDYAAWQNSMLRSDVMKKQEEYWMKQLSGCDSTGEVPVLDLLADYPRPELQSFEGGSIQFEIDGVVTKALRNIAKETGATMYMILMAGFNILLSKCSGQEDIIVGSPIANRQHADLENIIGMFANTLAMRNYPCGNKTFKEFLMELKSNTLRAYENQDYQFEELVDKLNIKRDMSRNPIFDTMFVVQNMQMNEIEIEGLKFKNREGDRGISRLDITIEAIEAEEEINMRTQYSRHLFKKETVEKLAGHLKKILTDIANNTELKISEIEIFEAEEKKKIEEKRRLASEKKGVTLAVAATFTAEPIEEYVRWWCGKYGEKIEVIFAPYNQIFQQLLDSESVISKNKGLNLLLIRFEDWIRDMQEESEKAKCELMENNYNKFIELIENANKNVLHIIGIFPVSSHLELSDEVAGCIEGLNNKWQEAMAAMDNVSVIDFREVAELYGIKEVFDSVKDKVGHMPFSDEYYAAIGTMIARRINAIKGNPFKVIAVDCDNTLWQGICGEDGALGVKVEEPHMELQKQLIKKHEEGMLIALCSKNNEADVWEVFDSNPQMVLKKEHLAAWKINWEPKSESIRKLAEELNLGIDSFIFIDDSGAECCDMMANNPQVLTLQLPEDPRQIPMYLRHIWAFDKVKVTEEDRIRTKSYQIERHRKEIQSNYTMEDFIKELGLKININEIEKEQIARVSQLTQRTNQFNLSTIRRTEEEVEELLRKPGMKGWAIEVEDKFGDYGLTGVVIMEKKEESIYLDTFLLSCRVLGRRVEAAILAEVGNYCRKEGIKKIEAAYYPTAKNQIVKEYLEKGIWNITEESIQYNVYEILTTDMPESTEHIECSYGKKEKKDRTVEVRKGLECILDHIGVEVNDIKAAKEYYKAMDYIDSDIKFDPQQSAYLALCSKAGFDTIELVNRINHERVFGDSDRIYHICYRVRSFTEVFERIKYYGIEWELISEAKPAIIFEGKEVLFIQVKGVGLVEFLQDSGIEHVGKEAAARRDTIRMPITDKENALKYYDMLGYVEVDRKYDGVKKVLSITLSRNGSGRIELLIAAESLETHRNICRICYERDAADEISSLTASDVTVEERYGSLNKAVLVMQPEEAKYSIYYSMEKEERESIEMNWQLSMEKEAELLHSSYILPIRYYTGKLLLRLPVYENENGSTSKRIYEAPRNETEEKLVSIWQEVLQIEKIGINDNFFELGGHSIKATRVVSKIYKELNVELSLREIFKYPTIKQFAENVLQGGKRERALLNKLTKDDDSKELTLVCIPYGGGNSVVYQPFADELAGLSEKVEVYSLALPGHDFREEETENRGIPELAEMYTEEIKKAVRTPIVLYGHCVGGALTCELARQLTINKLDLRAVVLGGVMPTKRTIFNSIKADPFERMTDKAIQEFLRGLGGFEEDMEDSELAFIMGNFRKDVKSSHEYYYNYYPALKKTVKPKVPVYCIVGDKDPLTKNYNKRCSGWKHYFAGKIYLKVIKEGKHYFIKYQAGEAAVIVKKIIDSIVLNSDQLIQGKKVL